MSLRKELERARRFYRTRSKSRDDPPRYRSLRAFLDDVKRRYRRGHKG